MSVQEVFSLAPLVALLCLAVFAVWALVWVVRYVRADSMLRASIRQAVRVRRTWKRFADLGWPGVRRHHAAPAASNKSICGL